MPVPNGTTRPDTTKAIIVEEVKGERMEAYFVAFVDEIRQEVVAGNILKGAA